ncbi:hypothetical protein Taro_023722 [Colocasia esculenta]|uniref:ATP-dependent Clp protease proteolytic subunit n=1 Tax=Colocasia esculenta TaxID=4460 RepID=A0A843UY69_COLES|nr:hypothetical protein [Colocasia esculenta]
MEIKLTRGWGMGRGMGAFLLSAGTKGKRYSLPNSRIMIHQPLGGAQGGQTDIDIQANEMLHHKANLNGYLAYHTGQSLEKINQDTDRDFFMSAKEAKEYGLIDGIVFALTSLSYDLDGDSLMLFVARTVTLFISDKALNEDFVLGVKAA